MKQYLWLTEYRKTLYIKEIDNKSKKIEINRINEYENGFDFYFKSDNKIDNIHETIDGEMVKHSKVNSVSEFNEMRKAFKDNNIDLYGAEPCLAQYIYKEYDVQAQNNDFKLPRVVFYDIETDMTGNIQTAAQDVLGRVKLNTIINNQTDECIILGLKDLKQNELNYIKNVLKHQNIKYIKCYDENELLIKTYDYFNKNCDILCGHNSKKFDDPYIINRGKKLNLNYKKVSCFNIVRDTKGSDSYGDYKSVDIYGISQVDMIDLLKVFYKKLPKYSLSYVSQVILDDDKIDYSEASNLDELYETNFAKYVLYGCKDTILLYRINKKINIMYNIIALGYQTSTNFDDYSGSVKSYENFIYNVVQLINKGVEFDLY